MVNISSLEVKISKIFAQRQSFRLIYALIKIYSIMHNDWAFNHYSLNFNTVYLFEII